MAEFAVGDTVEYHGEACCRDLPTGSIQTVSELLQGTHIKCEGVQHPHQANKFTLATPNY